MNPGHPVERLKKQSSIKVKRWSPLRRPAPNSVSVEEKFSSPPGMRWVQLLSTHDEDSRSNQLRDSGVSADGATAQLSVQRLRTYATRWPSRIGALDLRNASPVTYHGYLQTPPQEEDADQIAADVDRSHVDGLEQLAVPWFDAAEHTAALSRLLRAWCVRSPGGYCQGMNFCAAVLLVVMQHREAAAEGGAGAASPGGAAADATSFSPSSAISVISVPVLSGGGSGLLEEGLVAAPQVSECRE